MNTGTARYEASPSPRVPGGAQAQPRRDHWRQPLLLWAMVLAVATLSFYVHVLNEHVMRKEAQRLAAQQGSAPANARQQMAGRHAAAQAVRVAQTAPR